MKTDKNLQDLIQSEMTRLANDPAIISACKQSLRDAGKDDSDPSLSILIAIIPRLITYAITYTHSHPMVLATNPEDCAD